jgi:hypothetical protein
VEHRRHPLAWQLLRAHAMKAPRPHRARRWSQDVTKHSNALDLEKSAFTRRSEAGAARRAPSALRCRCSSSTSTAPDGRSSRHGGARSSWPRTSCDDSTVGPDGSFPEHGRIERPAPFDRTSVRYVCPAHAAGSSPLGSDTIRTTSAVFCRGTFLAMSACATMPQHAPRSSTTGTRRI